MCTIVLAHRVNPRHPLLVLANRDELYERASTAPQLLSAEPRVVGGRDLARSGTWLGVTPGGFFAAVTNQRTFRPPDPALGSRGMLVVDVLRAGSVEAGRRLAGALDPRAFNSFNLVLGDAREVWVAYARREEARLELVKLPEGLHVLANDRIDSPEFPKAQRAAALAGSLATVADEALASTARAILSDHELPPPERIPPPPAGSLFTADLVRRLQAICIHTPLYGTRSATVLALGDGRVERYLFAKASPCTAPFEDATALVTASGTPG